jgi:hypothetical protein
MLTKQKLEAKSAKLYYSSKSLTHLASDNKPSQKFKTKENKPHPVCIQAQVCFMATFNNLLEQ